MVPPSLLYSTVKIESSVSSCSKAPRGLFVQVQVGRIFTAISISPGNGSRQSLRRATFRAGRNLPDTNMLLPTEASGCFVSSASEALRIATKFRLYLHPAPSGAGVWRVVVEGSRVLIEGLPC